MLDCGWRGDEQIPVTQWDHEEEGQPTYHDTDMICMMQRLTETCRLSTLYSVVAQKFR